MKVNLLDQLSDKRESSVEKTNKTMNGLVDEAKMLLLESSSQERQLLSEAGLDHQFVKIEKEKGINLERATFENTYGEKVFTEAEIKDICIKYNLKFLHSKKFKGSVDPLVGAKIKRFFENAKIDGAKFSAQNDLFIMAPPQAFNLEEKPNPPVEADPVLFYRIHNRGNETMYAPVHKWGNDFTIFRRINGILRRNFYTWSAFEISIRSIVALSVLSFVMPFTLMNALWMVPCSAAIGLLAHAIYYGAKFEDKNGTAYELMAHKFSEEGWNQIYK